MLYRVLCFAILFATSGHGAAINPPREMPDAPLIDELSLAALLYGFRYSAEDVPHPMNAAQGNLMWDASGTGCVDGGAWDDPFPGGKGDLRSPVFCIPQPCAGLLSPEDLSREVYGRPLEEGEYQTYLDRLAETCGTLPEPAADDLASLDLEDYLRLASFQLVSLEDDATDLAPVSETPAPLMASLQRGGYFGPLTPVDYRVHASPSSLRRSFDRGPRYAGRWQDARSPRPGGSATPRGGSGDGAPERVSPLPPTTTVPTNPFVPSGPFVPPGPRDPLPPEQPPAPPPPGGGDLVQPAPVPLAGGLPLLLSALGALAAGRGLRQRRRSRRELIG